MPSLLRFKVFIASLRLFSGKGAEAAWVWEEKTALRSVPVAPRAGSASARRLPESSLRLLACWWSETEAEAQGEVAEGGLAPVPIRGTGDVRRVV